MSELGALDQFLGSPGALFILVRNPGALNHFRTLVLKEKRTRFKNFRKK